MLTSNLDWFLLWAKQESAWGRKRLAGGWLPYIFNYKSFARILSSPSTYLWHVRAFPLGPFLLSPVSQNNTFSLQGANQRVGFELDVVLIGRQQLHDVIRRVQVILATKRDQKIHHWFARVKKQQQWKPCKQTSCLLNTFKLTENICEVSRHCFTQSHRDSQH